jgi:hypothetical protein
MCRELINSNAIHLLFTLSIAILSGCSSGDADHSTQEKSLNKVNESTLSERQTNDSSTSANASDLPAAAKNTNLNLSDSISLSSSSSSATKLLSQGTMTAGDMAVADIYLTSLDGINIDSSRLTRIEICSLKKCYGQDIQLGHNLINSTDEGTAPQIASINLPSEKISKIISYSKSDNGIYKTEVVLPEELDLVNVTNKALILITVSDKLKDASSKLGLVSASGTYRAEGGEYIFYNPTLGINKTYNRRVKINIPKNATNLPRVFTLGIVEDGSKYPRVELFPYIDLSVPAKISIPKQTKTKEPSATPSPDPAYGTSNAMRVNDEDEITIEINRTTLIQDGVSKEIKIPKNGIETLAAASDPCANLISNPANQNIINNDINHTGFLNIRWCENQPPYVHIGVTQANDIRVTTDIVFSTQANSSWTNVLKLQRIDKYKNITLLINGFTWDGDEGTSSGQIGRAKGYVKGLDLDNRRGRIVAGGNSTGGSSQEMCLTGLPYGWRCTASISDGDKRVFDYATDRRTLRSWKTISETDPDWSQSSVVLSSSTSVVNQGNCSSDTLESRWSAVGTTPYGRLIYISSTASGTTNAAELCKVFKAFGVNNAIRLDGGPSASMMIDNVLQNPLSGLYWIKYGTSRFVAYAFGSFQTYGGAIGYNY